MFPHSANKGIGHTYICLVIPGYYGRKVHFWMCTLLYTCCLIYRFTLFLSLLPLATLSSSSFFSYPANFLTVVSLQSCVDIDCRIYSRCIDCLLSITADNTLVSQVCVVHFLFVCQLCSNVQFLARNVCSSL